jgi:hypothetical protein
MGQAAICALIGQLRMPAKVGPAKIQQLLIRRVRKSTFNLESCEYYHKKIRSGRSLKIGGSVFSSGKKYYPKSMIIFHKIWLSSKKILQTKNGDRSLIKYRPCAAIALRKPLFIAKTRVSYK